VSPALLPGQTVRLTFNGIIVMNSPFFSAGLRPQGVFVVSPPGAANFYTPGAHQHSVLLTGTQHAGFSMSATAFNSADQNLFPGTANNVYAQVQLDIIAEMVTGGPAVFANSPAQYMVEARK
jgi:hypothetical protein